MTLFTGNPSLLVSAPILQNYLVDDSTGLPLTAGIVTLYQDNSRTTLKNWYYQTGSPGAYTYTSLANPLTLGAAGTIVDPNGNDTLPFYYPYSELDNITPQPYYVVVVNSNTQAEFTRQNFPFVPVVTETTGVPTLDNILVNNVFWRNIGSLTTTNVTNAIIAPGAHEGLTSSDILFLKSSTGSTDSIAFTTFASTSTVLPDDITPEYYLNMTCTVAGSETQKCIQMPISLHVDTLQGSVGTFTIWAQGVSGKNQLNIYLYEFLGTGAASQPAPELVQTLTLSNSWTKYVLQIPFPTTTLTLSTTGDDAFYLQIGYPVGSGSACDINIAKPSIYLSSQYPTNDFTTYDVVNSVVSSPRTGDIRTSLNSFTPFGWVPLNDGTIGNSSSNATAYANVNGWPLFNLLWSLFNPYVTSTTNTLCQMYNSSASAVAYGASAYADWVANRQLSLTKQMGRTLLGTTPANSSYNIFVEQIAASNDGSGNLLLTVANTAVYWTGQPVVFTTTGALPGNLTATAVYYISTIANSTTMYVSTSYANSLASTYIAYSSAGSGTNTVTGTIQGMYAGQYAHVQLIGELAAHTHSTIGGGTTGANTYPYFNSNINNLTTATSGVIGGGNGTPANVVQPFTSMNFFMKL